MAETIRTVACIGNPIADKGHGEEAYERVFQLLAEAGEQHGFMMMDLTGSSFDESLANARTLAATYDALIVVGGDGMIALGANAVGGSGKPLGIVAVGSGNDFARGLELPVNRIDTAIEGIIGAIVRGTSIDVDMGHVTSIVDSGAGTVAVQNEQSAIDRYYAGMLSCGVDASINDRANHSHLPNGSLRYLAAVIVELTRLEAYGYHVRATLADGSVDERDIISPLLTVANSRHIGGGIEVSPYSCFDDGLLDLVWLDHMPKLSELAQIVPHIYDGRLLADPLFEWQRVRAVEITSIDGFPEPPVLMADGEYVGKLPVTVEALGRTLRVLVPPAVAADQLRRLDEQSEVRLRRDNRRLSQ